MAAPGVLKWGGEAGDEPVAEVPFTEPAGDAYGLDVGIGLTRPIALRRLTSVLVAATVVACDGEQSAPSRSISGTRPEVDTVTRRDERLIPSGCVSSFNDRAVAS